MASTIFAIKNGAGPRPRDLLPKCLFRGRARPHSLTSRRTSRQEILLIVLLRALGYAWVKARNLRKEKA